MVTPTSSGAAWLSRQSRLTKGVACFYASGTLRTPEESCVISTPLARIVSIAVVIAISGTAAGAWPHKLGQKARVRFLATSTLIRGTFGPNEDTYLAELSLNKGNERVLIRLIDAYPNETPPISLEDLTTPTGVTIRVRRDFECDRPFEQMIMRAAPGDPLAILPERLEYQPQLTSTPQPDSRLPCYRIVRR
jgi:hypothetical protein